MKKTVATLALAIVATTSLAGCGGGSSAYCDEVTKDKASLNSFGEKRTNAAYADYAAMLSRIAKVAPTKIAKDWTTLSKATTGIITAQKTAGIALEDMADQTKLTKVSKANLTSLNTAYEAFNGTTAQRNAVVKNVLQECDIKLK